MELIEQYFNLTDRQKDIFSNLKSFYYDWNEKINLISRKDFDSFYLKHVLHSLSILKFYTFKAGTRFIDIGTGGGFPGIPLAIMCPDLQFDLIDGTGKKIKVVNDAIREFKLPNVKAMQLRAEESKEKYDFVLARAVSSMDRLKPWSRSLLHHTNKNSLPNGLIAMKGGDPKLELQHLAKADYHEISWIKDVFKEEYFKEKYLLYVQF